MKLSRLSNRQLRRLLAQGEVRFGLDDNKKKLRRALLGIFDDSNAIFSSLWWKQMHSNWIAIQKEDPVLFKELDYQMKRFMKAVSSASREVRDFADSYLR